ncbi:hypothetical protein WJX72_004031 [[Myrmecia] bisecta]|uniref:Cyclin A n=1 Tax=[Myrmecia] bisecta TaxID=41462 RepID=A0AAW1Q0V2_9CHLO
MSRQGLGPVTRSAAASGFGVEFAAGPGNNVQRKAALQTGKRVAGGEPKYVDAAAGSKKNRAAFEDITNRGESQPPSRKEHICKPNETSTAYTYSLAHTNQVGIVSDVLQAQLRHNGSAGAAHMDTELCSPGAQRAWKDIDALEQEDQLACSEYINDIMHHLFQAETRRRPSTTYMETLQRDINATMRGILVDWLVEVAQEYKLVSDTLYIAVGFIDRYLSAREVVRAKLQLVGVACMLIAAKYEEIYAPQIEEFCYITDNTYSREEILAMEHEILGLLQFELTVPNAKVFSRRFIKAAAADESAAAADGRLECLVSYLTELTLPEYAALGFLPSQIAASATLLANFTLGRPAWTLTLQHYTGYTPAELKPCTILIHHLFLNARRSSMPAICDKYASPKYVCVSAVGTPEQLPEWLFQF